MDNAVAASIHPHTLSEESAHTLDLSAWESEYARRPRSPVKETESGMRLDSCDRDRWRMEALQAKCMSEEQRCSFTAGIDCTLSIFILHMNITCHIKFYL